MPVSGFHLLKISIYFTDLLPYTEQRHLSALSFAKVQRTSCFLSPSCICIFVCSRLSLTANLVVSVSYIFHISICDWLSFSEAWGTSFPVPYFSHFHLCLSLPSEIRRTSHLDHSFIFFVFAFLLSMLDEAQVSSQFLSCIFSPRQNGGVLQTSRLSRGVDASFLVSQLHIAIFTLQGESTTPAFQVSQSHIYFYSSRGVDDPHVFDLAISPSHLISGKALLPLSGRHA